MGAISRITVVLIAACISVSAQERNKITVQPEGISKTITVTTEKRQQMTYGMDFERLWSWNGLKGNEKDKISRLAVRECRVDYVRVAINGGAEINEGRINWEAYDQIIDCMNHLKAAKPDIKFFASPRPFHEAVKDAPYTCFPLWITEFEPAGKKGKMKFKEFNPDKAADYLVRYLDFIRSKGFEISYMDAKNENDFLRPGELLKMVSRMKEKLGDRLPLIISPSSFDYGNGADWLGEAIKGNNTAFFQIASTHNTKEEGSLDEFTSLARKAGKPSWNTELHGFNGPDNVAAVNAEILFKQIRAGVSGISEWLSLGNEKKEHKMFRAVDGRLVVMRTYYIFKQLVNTSGGGNYLVADIPEGIKTSVAFIKNDTLTVWALNADDKTTVNFAIRLAGHRIDRRDVEIMAWGPADPREGSVSVMKVTAGADRFSCKLPPCTLHCYTFKVKE